MIELPTDRLHKLFAIGGIVVAVLGAYFAQDRYHEAELRRIEAQEKATSARVAYDRLAEAVEHQADISKIARTERDPVKKAAALDEFWKLNEQTEKLKTAVDVALSELRKHGDINRHFSFMQKLWLYVGAACLLVGALASVGGFLWWVREERRARKAG